MKNKKLMICAVSTAMIWSMANTALATELDPLTGTEQVIAEAGADSGAPESAAASDITAAPETIQTETAASQESAPSETAAPETLPAETVPETAAPETSAVSETAAPETTAAPPETTAAPEPTTAAQSNTGSVAGPGARVGQGLGSGSGIGSELGTGLGDPGRSIPFPVGSGVFSNQIPNPIVPIVERYTYDQMVQNIQQLSNTYGSLMKTNIIGTTLDGRNMYEIILGNPDAPKHVLIQAGIHAREYMTPLLVMKQLEYGLAFYNSEVYAGQPLSAMLDQVAIHFVPMSNPDGIGISQFGLSAIRSEELRQTIMNCYAMDLAEGRTTASLERYLLYWKANGRGTDLNQNFPAGWEKIVGCAHPSYASYKGVTPLSEPESQALANLANSRTWAVSISYHSMGNIIYWDYAGNQKAAESSELAQIVAGITGYRPAGASGNGGFKDWTQIKENPIPGLTIEVGSVSCPLPVSQFAEVWNKNKSVWAAVANYALTH